VVDGLAIVGKVGLAGLAVPTPHGRSAPKLVDPAGYVLLAVPQVPLKGELLTAVHSVFVPSLKP